MNEELSKRILSSIVLVPLAFFFIIKGSILFNLFILICFIITSYEWHKISKQKSYNFIGYIFIIISFFSALKVRNLDQSVHYFLIILLTCIFTDIGGYIFGKIFKGPKLTKISPKKTYSGMIGGYLLSLLSIYIFYNTEFNFSKSTEISAETLLFIFLVSTSSQLGDIIISYFKRRSNIKDSGNIIPGHGGILDRIDGMIFAFPFSYIILKTSLVQYI